MINERKKITFRNKKYTNNNIFANGMSILDMIAKSKNERLLSLLRDNKDYLAFKEIFMLNILRIFNQKLCVNNNMDNFVDFAISKDSNLTNNDNYNLQSISLEELFEINYMIYCAYKSGGDYRKMILILNMEINAGNEARQSYCVSEYANGNYDDISSLRLNSFDSCQIGNESALAASSLSSSSSEQDGLSAYYDNSFWQSSSYSILDDSSFSELNDLS